MRIEWERGESFQVSWDEINLMFYCLIISRLLLFSLLQKINGSKFPPNFTSKCFSTLFFLLSLERNSIALIIFAFPPFDDGNWKLFCAKEEERERLAWFVELDKRRFIPPLVKSKLKQKSIFEWGEKEKGNTKREFSVCNPSNSIPVVFPSSSIVILLPPRHISPCLCVRCAKMSTLLPATNNNCLTLDK